MRCSDVTGSALFSPCRRYRLRLSRCGLVGEGSVAFIMLNPSTADESTNDPTVERCWRRSQKIGFEQMVIVNLFALRSPYPGSIYAAGQDAIGQGNTEAILDAAAEADMVFCAWGEHGRYLNRGADIRRALIRDGRTLHVLSLNRSGQPKHPLYVGYDVAPFVWDAN